MTVEIKYNGPIERGMIFTCPDNDGVLGLRRIRVVGRDFNDYVIYENLPGRMRIDTHSLGRCPELNLRIVFELEQA